MGKYCNVQPEKRLLLKKFAAKTPENAIEAQLLAFSSSKFANQKIKKNPHKTVLTHPDSPSVQIRKWSRKNTLALLESFKRNSSDWLAVSLDFQGLSVSVLQKTLFEIINKRLQKMIFQFHISSTQNSLHNISFQGLNKFVCQNLLDLKSGPCARLGLSLVNFVQDALMDCSLLTTHANYEMSNQIVHDILTNYAQRNAGLFRLKRTSPKIPTVKQKLLCFNISTNDDTLSFQSTPQESHNSITRKSTFDEVLTCDLKVEDHVSTSFDASRQAALNDVMEVHIDSLDRIFGDTTEMTEQELLRIIEQQVEANRRLIELLEMDLTRNG